MNDFPNGRRKTDVNIPREHDERSTDHGLRFYNVVTLGNLITAIPVAAAVMIWGLRLEGRVDHEIDLRQRMERQIVQLGDENKSLAVRIDDRLGKINDGIIDLKLAVVELRKLPSRDGGAAKP